MRRLAFAVLMTLVPGCGQASQPAREATVIAALGDSITAGSPAWDPDPAVRERIGPDVAPDSQFSLWAQARLGRGDHPSVAGYRRLGRGDHPSVAGHRRLGALVTRP